MKTQPEALRLADQLDLYATGDNHQQDIEQAADELRRLHKVNQDVMSDLKQTTTGYAIRQYPQPVGYWMLYKDGALNTSFTMYNKPTDEQIKNTEQLLGWHWKDAAWEGWQAALAQRPWVGLTDGDWSNIQDRRNTSLDTFQQGVVWAADILKGRNK